MAVEWYWVQVWLVSGTPFPRGDVSAYGINQLLGIQLKFVLSNSPFMFGRAARKGDYSFLKCVIYIVSTPFSFMSIDFTLIITPLMPLSPSD